MKKLEGKPFALVGVNSDEDRQALKQVLPWKPYGLLVSVARLLGLLLLVAAARSSLSALVRRFRFGFSHETARQADVYPGTRRDMLRKYRLDYSGWDR